MLVTPLSHCFNLRYHSETTLTGMFATPTALIPVRICCSCKNGPLWLEKKLETFCAMAKTHLHAVVLFVQSEGACGTEVSPYYTAKFSYCNKNDFLLQWPRSFLYSL